MTSPRLQPNTPARGGAWSAGSSSSATSLHGPLAAAFTTGLHAACYESVGFMVIAAILSGLRGSRKKN